MDLLSKFGIALSGTQVALIAGVAAAIAIVVALIIANWDTIKEKTLELWEKLKPIFENIKDFVIETWQKIVETVMPIVEKVVNFVMETWTWLWENLKPVLEAMWDFIKVAFEGIKQAIELVLGIIYYGVIKPIIDKIVLLWELFGDTLLSFIKIEWERIKSIFEGALKIIQGVFKIFTGAFTGDWKKSWEGVKNIFSGVWTAFKGIAKGALDAVLLVVNTVLNTIKGVFNKVWDSILKITQTDFTSMKNTITNIIDGIYNWLKQKVEFIKNIFNFKWELPHIKLPHFRVTGKFGWSWDGGLEIPHISVDWYKKAKNQPYMFNSPQIIGVGDVPEVVVGADYFKDLAANKGTQVINNININAEINNDTDVQTLADRISNSIQYSVDRRVAAWR